MKQQYTMHVYGTMNCIDFCAGIFPPTWNIHEYIGGAVHNAKFITEKTVEFFFKWIYICVRVFTT